VHSNTPKLEYKLMMIEIDNENIDIFSQIALDLNMEYESQAFND
jgi:hypothetical protein